MTAVFSLMTMGGRRERCDSSGFSLRVRCHRERKEVAMWWWWWFPVSMAGSGSFSEKRSEEEERLCLL